MSWVFTDEMRFYLHEGETLLDGMIRTEHKEARYMCREGYCGSCKMIVKQKIGSIIQTQTPLANLAPNEILACCCTISGAVRVGYCPTEDQQDGVYIFSPQSQKNTISPMIVSAKIK